MPEPPDKQPDRLEREINEILAKVSAFPIPVGPRNQYLSSLRSILADPVAAFVRWFKRELSHASSTQMLLLSFVLIIIGFFFDDVLPFAGSWLLVAGALLFIVSFALTVFAPRRRSAPRRRYWRGHAISDDAKTLAERIRRWYAAHH